jgi:hypothetical protein
MVVGGHAAPYHEALLEIQRNNFERETIALRKLVARLIDGSEGNLHITRQRRFRRQRSTER